MIFWVGFIGKLVDLILTKVIGKQVDLKLDERKRAARAFVRLHEAIAQLENAAWEFLALAEPVVEGRRSYLWKSPLRKLAGEADDASRDFGDALAGLLRVIGIYDSALAFLLGRV